MPDAHLQHQRLFGRWWMIHPEIDQLTQARHAGEIEDMARSLIAVSTGQPIDAIAVHVRD
ncbi:MAG: hypothetical protein QJR12_01295 [Mycobacterium sp.]|uniref:hypothetical protein n=1 Tax=Mycobacterium sp. TaxID=1785 RepID=UPI00262DAEE5|nr:hypothetical protein [Mycobacterium sp.]MDI3312952.1 hypothetical protein [Mycobacterium sp.]